MAGDNLTICLFLIAMAANFLGVGVSQAGWRHKILLALLFGGGLLFFAAGAAWPWLKDWSPIGVRADIEQIASSPVSWFVVMMSVLILGLLRPGQHSSQVNQNVEPAAPLLSALSHVHLPRNSVSSSTHERKFSNRTAAELLAMCNGVTPLQASRALEPFDGLWLRVSANVIQLSSLLGKSTDVVTKLNNGMITGSFSKKWDTELLRISPGDIIVFIGRINKNYGGLSIILNECEPES